MRLQALSDEIYGLSTAQATQELSQNAFSQHLFDTEDIVSAFLINPKVPNLKEEISLLKLIITFKTYFCPSEM